MRGVLRPTPDPDAERAHCQRLLASADHDGPWPPHPAGTSPARRPQPGRVDLPSPGIAATLRAALRRLTLIEAAEYTAALAVLLLWLGLALGFTG